MRAVAVPNSATSKFLRYMIHSESVFKKYNILCTLVNIRAFSSSEEDDRGTDQAASSREYGRSH
jgi:hypothetical protein